MSNRRKIILHLTNVTGVGATQLLLSLLPAFERSLRVVISEIHVPDRGGLANYQAVQPEIVVKPYKRWLPNALSRAFECLVFSRKFDGSTPLFVFGDIPLRCEAPQIVFVQTSHLIKQDRFKWDLASWKYRISRVIFHFNSRCAKALIVQTEVMRSALCASYPELADRILIIQQPAPNWLLERGSRRTGVLGRAGEALKLIYPAAGYPHKNHKLLAQIRPEAEVNHLVKSLKLTLPSEKSPAAGLPWIQCVGLLSPDNMIKAYDEVDGLLFLSTDESYGLPLVEAMFLGLPIICPDLPYAHALCGDGAIYFDPISVESLQNSIKLLHARLSEGWWPDWSSQMCSIPRSWDEVADAMVALAFDETRLDSRI